jgi:LAO/AO transport system kinase
VSASHPLADGVRAGDRRALSRAITLVESRRRDDAEQAEALLAELYPAIGRALRVGVTGPPGVGKSTLLDALGMHAVGAGQRVGVMSVDPTSHRRGGSLLGDRVRMARLSQSDGAFIRASPSGGAVGGLGRRTREALVLLEAAGFSLIFVESVGVGQGEIAVTEVSDLVLLVQTAGAGDDVQGMKRGLLEHADVVVFNKAEGPQAAVAERAARELASLLEWMRPGQSRVELVSALEDRGIDGLYRALLEEQARLTESGELAERRRAQRRIWLSQAIEELAIARQSRDPDLDRARRELERAVEEGELAPPLAARQVLGPDNAAITSGGA